MKIMSIISVVTVCFNAKDEISTTMRSVLNQTYNNIEYIIIDGKSTDGTLDRINEIKFEYPERKIKIISEPDRGVYDAMNKGVDMASGDWINFMNAGDSFVSESVINDFFLSYLGDAGVVFGNTLQKEGKRITRNKGYLRNNDFPNLGHQSTFVRTTLMKKIHFDLSYKISADFAFLYSLYKSGVPFHYVDKDVALYDMGGLSSVNRELLYREHCLIRDEIPSKYKILKYKIEDVLPLSLIRFLRNVLQPYA